LRGGRRIVIRALPPPAPVVFRRARPLIGE
jgi:hypothetical protein